METKKKAKPSKKAQYEINPEIPDTQVRNLRMEDNELSETLTLVGRMKAAKKMRRLSASGILDRGKRRKELLSMTSKRASTLGWKAARRQLKQGIAKGRDLASLAPGEKARIEKIADRKKEARKAIARKLTRAYLMQSFDPVNKAFELMLEGKRYHQLYNKDGGVKFDMRFKHFREKSNPHFEADNEEEVLHAVEEMFDVVQNETTVEIKEAAAVKALGLLYEKTGDLKLSAHRIAKSFDLSPNDLIEAYSNAE